MENLSEKYAEILESKKMPQIAESEKSSMAILLENQANEETKIMGESTVAGDVAQFVPIFMPLARRVQPALIANELVGVQPMTSPTGYLYTLAFKYTGMGADKNDRDGGRISPVAGGQIVQVADASAITKGDVVKVGAESANVIYVEDNFILIDAKIASATDELNDNTDVKITDVVVTYSNELTFRKILKGYTGSLPTSQAEILGYDMSEIGFEVKQTSIAAESRKLKAEYTVEMYQDLKAMHGLNADEELMNMMAVEVQNELDREIVEKVNGWAAPAGDYTIGRTGGHGSERFEMESMAHIGIKIANESREIARLTRRGQGNTLIVSPKVATVLETLKGFKAIENASTVGAGVGVSVIGKFNGMKVVQDSFATSDYCTVLYKGSDRRDAIGYYAPYVPVSFTRVVHPDSGQPAIILNTRYGIKENPLNENEGIYARTFNVNFDASSILA
jgi:hypothetical protein